MAKLYNRLAKLMEYKKEKCMEQSHYEKLLTIS